MSYCLNIPSRSIEVHVSLESLPNVDFENADLVREALIDFPGGTQYRACFAIALAREQVPYWDDNQLVFVADCSDHSILEAIEIIVEAGKEESAFEVRRPCDTPSTKEAVRQKRSRDGSSVESDIGEELELAVLNRVQQAMQILWHSSRDTQRTEEWLRSEIQRYCEKVIELSRNDPNAFW